MKFKIIGLFTSILLLGAFVANAESSADVNNYSAFSTAAQAASITYSSDGNGTEMLSDNVGVESSMDDCSGYKSVETEMREVSNGVYEMLNEEGEVIAVYEEMEGDDTLQNRASWTID